MHLGGIEHPKGKIVREKGRTYLIGNDGWLYEWTYTSGSSGMGEINGFFKKIKKLVSKVVKPVLSVASIAAPFVPVLTPYAMGLKIASGVSSVSSTLGGGGGKSKVNVAAAMASMPPYAGTITPNLPPTWNGPQDSTKFTDATGYPLISTNWPVEVQAAKAQEIYALAASRAAAATPPPAPAPAPVAVPVPVAVPAPVQVATPAPANIPVPVAVAPATVAPTGILPAVAAQSNNVVSPADYMTMFESAKAAPVSTPAIVAPDGTPATGNKTLLFAALGIGALYLFTRKKGH